MMQRKRLEVLCVQAIKWKGDRARRLVGGYKLLHAGRDGRSYFFIYSYAACSCVAASFSGDAAVPLMQCPCYQHAGTHFADLRMTTG